MPKFQLVLLIHAHQPVGNFDSVFERVYQVSYLPFLETLARHPSVRAGLHYSGPLLEWFEARHPEYLQRLEEMVARKQVEMVGGGFYEPILIAIPPWDQVEQIRRMRDYLSRRFGHPPAGAWLAERVWEPQLPSILSNSAVQYTLVDDVHFIAAGFESDQLHGDYICEDGGRIVRVFAGLKILRYLLPFAPVEQGIDFLRQCADRHPGGMAAMGDDLEKFGAWPGTFDLCFRDRWLDRFFSALESSSDWLATVTPAEYLAAHPPLGRADLPTASYTEMMEWALPTPARTNFQNIEKEFAGRPDALRFLRGGTWRGFFSKYSEANLLHKKMLRVSEQLHALDKRAAKGPRAPQLAEARTHSLRAQCNDAYWHGIFGGLYAPHLRSALWKELIGAEALLADSSAPLSKPLQVERCDYDSDGNEEILAQGRSFSALLRPSDGGTLAMFDFRPAGAALLNSLQRRPESYHARLGEPSHITGGTGAVSIHELVRSKEAGLEKCLRYDRWPRNAFRLLVFPVDKTFQDYRELRLGEHPALAGGPYDIAATSSSRATLGCKVPRDSAAAAGNGSSDLWSCAKKFNFADRAAGCRVDCEVELVSASAVQSPLAIGLELVLNLLAPNDRTRYFDTGAVHHPLEWSGAMSALELPRGLRIVDEWQGVAITLHAPAAAEFWVAPIETISESEDGFERVYQGSQILILWAAEIGLGVPWRGKVTLDVQGLAR